MANSFISSQTKRPQDLLLLVFGLTHLREWIAPGYKYDRPAVTPAEHFYQKIFTLKEFKILQNLCNRSKHMSTSNTVMGTLHQSTIDVASVPDFDRGFPTAYSVGEQDMDDVIRVVLKFYEDHWFGITNRDESGDDGGHDLAGYLRK